MEPGAGPREEPVMFYAVYLQLPISLASANWIREAGICLLTSIGHRVRGRVRGPRRHAPGRILRDTLFEDAGVESAHLSGLISSARTFSLRRQPPNKSYKCETQ